MKSQPLSSITLNLEALFRVIKRLADEVSTEKGLTLHQVVTLHRLREYEPCTMSDLKRGLDVTTGAITGLIDRLEKLGLVERRPSLDDRRVIYLDLTSAGQDTVNAIWEAWERRLEGWLSRVPDAQRSQLEPVIRALVEAGEAV